MINKTKWIWAAQNNPRPFNQTIIAQKTISLKDTKSAQISISADSFYRLYINGIWINDGPARAWPDHYRFDVIDISRYIISGINEIRIIAQFYGCGTFHQVPLEAALIAELEIINASGKKKIISTDKSWQAAISSAWIDSTIKASIQHEACEQYDARLEKQLVFKPAKELYSAHNGPWKNLQERDCPLLTKEPQTIHSICKTSVVAKEPLSYTVPIARLLYPDLIEANRNLNYPCAIVTILRSQVKQTIEADTRLFTAYLNGKPFIDGKAEAQKGDNVLVCVAEKFWTHFKEAGIYFKEFTGTLINPIKTTHNSPFVFIRFEELLYCTSDMHYPDHIHKNRESIKGRTLDRYKQLINDSINKTTFVASWGKNCELIPAEQLLVAHPHWSFIQRKTINDATPTITNANAALYNNPEYAVVNPCKEGDTELCFDLGTQNCGYIAFDIEASSGTQLDFFAVEYISETGAIQHTISHRNGFRYVCKEGWNNFTSIKRRSGRFIFLTIRNTSRPVNIRQVNFIESTYPVEFRGSFNSSNREFARIWDISARTLKLCMEDTFTDCPLYEKTLWIGDMRNEAIFSYPVFGAEDLVRRCIRLGGESLERYPLVGAQVPSGWDMLIPAWSFLWGISVWEYYFHSGDRKFLKESFRWVIKNIKNASKLTDKRGLFSGPFWNFFDWSGNDYQKESVIHNTLLLIGAIDAAVKCADALQLKKDKSDLLAIRKRFTVNAQKQWDKKRGNWPDSWDNDGNPSPKTTQHNIYLGLLYDVVPAKEKSKAIDKLLNPPPGMIVSGSPFAIQFLWETLDKTGKHEEIINAITKNYSPMLDIGSTTVWETFPKALQSMGSFPTRSHCHAWSSAPIYFIHRLILGLKQTGIGGSSFEVSPVVTGQDWAEGTNNTIKGPIHCSWHKKGKTLDIKVKAPKGVKITFKPNSSLSKFKINFVLN
ncbi:MAG: alpha-L-rhamnosidase N-terminal domain-containing protein [Fibrobacteres bacterium]|nr:alpha-L-rhamnosidase N-terminal domain-containing protein [Fibrobacterota bacterium]